MGGSQLPKEGHAGAGWPRGVDRDATMSLYKPSSPVINLFFADCFWGPSIRESVATGNVFATVLIVFCPGVSSPETPAHILHGCGAWEDDRGEEVHSCRDMPLRAPRLQLNGIMPNDRRIMAARKQLCTMREPPLAPQAIFKQTSTLETYDDERRVVIYTDGSCTQPSQPDLRRAGYAAYWGNEHPANFALPLEGLAQSNQRAELAAVVRCISQDPRRLHIKTDSMYVLKGANRARQWRRTGWKHDHGDLWTRLSDLLAADWGRVIFTHVKAHCTWDDVLQGRIAMIDKVGNARANSLACEGSEKRQALTPITDAAGKRKEFTEALHMQFLCILREHHRDSQAVDFLYDQVHLVAPALHPADQLRVTEP